MIPNEVNAELTQSVIECDSYKELVKVIRDNAPFISYSRNTPVEWTAERLIANIGAVRSGIPLNCITRANGLRSKVAELLLVDNYGDDWEE